MEGNASQALIIGLLIPIGFPFALLLVWSLVLTILSAVSGWSSLAGRYRTAANPVLRGLSSQSGWVGPVHYSRTLNLSSGPDGLRLSIMPLFGFRHPPLLIPWSDIGTVTPKQGLGGRLVEVVVGSEGGVTLRLPEAALAGRPEPTSG